MHFTTAVDNAPSTHQTPRSVVRRKPRKSISETPQCTHSQSQFQAFLRLQIHNPLSGHTRKVDDSTTIFLPSHLSTIASSTTTMFLLVHPVTLPCQFFHGSPHFPGLTQFPTGYFYLNINAFVGKEKCV